MVSDIPGLKRDGASNGASLGFLISTPQTGVDSILVSASFLGWPFALFKVLAAAVTGLVGGWISDRVPDDEAVERDLGVVETNDSARGFRAMLAHSHDLLDFVAARRALRVQKLGRTYERHPRVELNPFKVSRAHSLLVECKAASRHSQRTRIVGRVSAPFGAAHRVLQ